MPLPWQRKVGHVASQVAAVVTGIDSLATTPNEPAPTPPNPDVIEARWRASQDKAHYYAENFISMQEAMTILDKSEEYIRACERLGQIGIERWKGAEYVYRFDVLQEERRIKEFPYQPAE